MYRPNQIVEYNGRYGRVLFHDPITYSVHVMFKVNDNTWKVKKCEPFFCKPAQVFLWTVESAFCTRHLPKQHHTPGFKPLKKEIDHFMLL